MAHTVLIDYEPLRSFLATDLQGVLLETIESKGHRAAIPAVAQSKLAADEDDEDRFRGCSATLQSLADTRKIIILPDSREDRDLWDRVARLTEFPAAMSTRAVNSMPNHLALAHAQGLKAGGETAVVLVDDYRGKMSVEGGGIVAISTVQILSTAAGAGVVRDVGTMRNHFERLSEYNRGLPDWADADNLLNDPALYLS